MHEVGGSPDHQFITVNVCGSADGTRLPPFILFKGKHLYNTWTEGGPAGACYGVSPSGWMEEANFFQWFDKQIYPAVKHLTETGPVVMFFDGHYSHLSIALIKRASEIGILLFCLPPNTTHVLQPLDVGVFGPVKSTWRRVLKLYKIRTRASNVTKEIFPSLIKQLWEKPISPDHLKNGFKSTGLFPFNSTVISSDLLAPSLLLTTSPSTPPPGSRSPDIQINAIGTLTSGTKETPIRVELRAFFVNELRPQNGGRKARWRRRVELKDVGEVLTNDELYEVCSSSPMQPNSKPKGKERRLGRNVVPLLTLLVMTLTQTMEIQVLLVVMEPVAVATVMKHDVASVGNCTQMMKPKIGLAVMAVRAGGISGAPV